MKKILATILFIMLLVLMVSPGFAEVEVQQNGATVGGAAVRINFKGTVSGQGTDKTVLTSEVVGTLDEGLDLSAATILNSDIRFSNDRPFYSGAAASENAVFTEVGSSGLEGSLYISTGGKLFIQVTSSFTNSDWELVTSSSAE